MKRGDIYMVSLDPGEAHEQRGTRPVLIVSPDRFNHLTRVPIVVPITSGGNFARTAGFAVLLDSPKTRIKGVARCDQPRPVDLSARQARKVESISPELIDEVLAKLVVLFS